MQDYPPGLFLDVAMNFSTLPLMMSFCSKSVQSRAAVYVLKACDAYADMGQ